jgi:hypothetical protein
MKFFASLFILIYLISSWSVTSHADVTPYPAALRAVRSADSGSGSKIDIQFCEVGTCRSLGRNGGYRISEWRQIRNICAQQAEFAGPVSHVVQSVLIGAAVFTGLPVVWGVAMLTTPPSANDQAATQAAGTLLPGAMRVDQNFTLPIDQFVFLRNGIEQCAFRFNQKARAEAIFRSCANPLICDLEQAGQVERYY